MRRWPTSLTRSGLRQDPPWSLLLTVSGPGIQISARLGRQGLLLVFCILQHRLDLITFELSGPSLTHFPIGECDLDRLVIFSVRTELGLQGGNTLCGNQTGQHSE